MTNTKMTKKDYFRTMLAMDSIKARQDLVDFINHEIELLERKNSSDRKPTANQLKNNEIKEIILDEMRANPNKIYTATQLLKIVEPHFPDTIMTNQRISAIMRKMWQEGGSGEVKRVVDKRVTYFQIA